MRIQSTILMTGCIAVTTIAAQAATVEKGPGQTTALGQTIIGAQLFTPGEPTGGAYINPTGILIGSTFHLYVQGGQDQAHWSSTPWPDCVGDQLLLFRTSNTASNLVAEFPTGTVRRITPCLGDSPSQYPLHSSDPVFDVDHHWTLGNVFFAAGHYRIVSAASNYPEASEFSELVWGRSSDGLNWYWEPFIKSTAGYNMPEVLLEYSHTGFICVPGGSCTTFTHLSGYFRFTFAGVGRMKVAISSVYPRGFRVSILANNGQWLSVDDWTGEFSFTPMDIWPNDSARPKSIVSNGSTLELWAAVDPHYLPGCCPSCGCDYYDSGGGPGSFAFRTINSDGTLGSAQPLYSNLRCMPSPYREGRLYPFRYNDSFGRKLLYSVTNDDNICDDEFSVHGNPFVGTYIVVTEVE